MGRGEEPGTTGEAASTVQGLRAVAVVGHGAARRSQPSPTLPPAPGLPGRLPDATASTPGKPGQLASRRRRYRESPPRRCWAEPEGRTPSRRGISSPGGAAPPRRDISLNRKSALLLGVAIRTVRVSNFSCAGREGAAEAYPQLASWWRANYGAGGISLRGIKRSAVSIEGWRYSGLGGIFVRKCWT